MTINEAMTQAAALQEAGKLAEAEQLYRLVLGTVPDHPAALVKLAEIAMACGHADAACKIAERATQVDPSPPSFTALGSLLRGAGRIQDAERAFAKAVEMAPLEAAAHCNLAMVQWDQKRLAEARSGYERAAELDPQLYAALHGLMNVAGDMGDFQVAVEAGRRAVAIGCDTPRFWSDFAIALNDVGDLTSAVEAAQRAVDLDPQNGTLHFNLAQLLLLSGDFERGWRENEWRWSSLKFPSPIRRFTQPMWDGSGADLQAEKRPTVLLHAEQGLGDAIMFARYIPLAAQRAKVIVECQQEVADLLRTVPATSEVIRRGDPLPPFDYHVPFLSLPLIFQTKLQTIPTEVPYVSAPGDRTATWRERLAGGDGLRVGITWAGAASHINDVNRSMPFEVIAGLKDVPGVRFYALQKGPRSADAAGADWLTDLGPQLHDFSDTAAVVENLDLVISVDTSVVHVAGALARPVWVMLPFAPDWRWLVSFPETSPWYPTMKLFRQSRPRQWADVVQRVAKELQSLR